MDELADKLGFTGQAKENFLAECDRYNELFDAQEDPDFGKEAIVSPSCARLRSTARPGRHATDHHRRIRINKDCQAIDTEGNPIEGLYAAGDCSGSVFSGCYPDQLHGFACGRTMTEALHVVKQMA